MPAPVSSHTLPVPDAASTRSSLLDFPVTKLAAKGYKEFEAEVAENGSAVSDWVLVFKTLAPLKSTHIFIEILDFEPTGPCLIRKITSYARTPSEKPESPNKLHGEL